MKTAEQITKAELERIGLDSVDDIDDWGHLERIVTLVIEADRAQRAENTLLIELDEEHEPHETVSEVLNLIEQGYESGIYPSWELNYSFDRESDQVS